jgi:predicted phage terminase large subunit-like protein
MQQGLSWIESVIDDVPSPTVNIESVHAQRFLLQEAQDRGLPVTGVDQSMTKEDRLIQLSVPFESDRIRLINFDTDPQKGLDDRWDELVQEWIAFPDGTHDDMLDAVELALRNINIGATYGGEPIDLYGRQ